MKLGLWLLSGQLDDVHFVKLFLAGHGHVSGGDPGLIAGHEILELANFLLLTAVGSLQLGFFYGVDLLEVVVIADIAVQLLIFHVIDDVDHFI